MWQDSPRQLQLFFGQPRSHGTVARNSAGGFAGRCRPPRQSRALVQPPACVCAKLAHGLAR
eukprot:6915746-Alexandrium_andersonii.AAC.1